MSCNVCRMSFNLYFPQGHLIVCIQTYAHTHTYRTVVMRSLDVEPRRQTDRQGDTQTEGTKQQNRIRSWVGSVFFSPFSRLCLSSVRAAVNRFSAQVTRRITVTSGGGVGGAVRNARPAPCQQQQGNYH